MWLLLQMWFLIPLGIAIYTIFIKNIPMTPQSNIFEKIFLIYFLNVFLKHISEKIFLQNFVANYLLKDIS